MADSPTETTEKAPLPTMGRRAFLMGSLASLFLAACGKKPPPSPPEQSDVLPKEPTFATLEIPRRFLDMVEYGKSLRLRGNNNTILNTSPDDGDIPFFSAEDPETVIKRINDITGKAREFFASATYLFITFGTSRVYRWKETGKIVSNCHKIPASYFSHELLGVEEITDIWKKWLDTLHKLYPHLKTVFTISPVRHWKDGAHGNQVSKSTLFLAVEELLKHSSCPGYFPAYEIFMDELRDYRFYDADMLHPSDTATEYIWERFTSTFFDTRTLELWNEVSKISRSIAHRIQSGTADEMKTFARSMLSKINAVLVKEPGLDLEKEKVYFLEMI